MDRSEVRDLIDLYGANSDRWPAHVRDDALEAIATDDELKAYYDQEKALDEEFQKDWDDDSDGASMKEDDEDDLGEDGEEDNPEDDAAENEDHDDSHDEDDADADDSEEEEGEVGSEGEEDEEGAPGGPGDQDGDEGAGDAGDEVSDWADGGEGDETDADDADDSADEDGEPGEDTVPMDIDFSHVKDTDSALEEVLDALYEAVPKTGLQYDFTRDHDVVEPYQLNDPRFDVRAIEEEVRKLAGPVQSELQRLIVARSQSVNVPGFRSGRLNAPSLHRIAAGDDRVFRRKHVTQTRKVSVSLVCDLSGSMSGAKCMTALISAWVFSEVLDRLKIANEVCGFTSTGGDVSGKYPTEVREYITKLGISPSQCRTLPFWMPIFKSYEERFTSTTKQKLAEMATKQKGLAQNNDALAIDYAGRRLVMRPEPRKIMIVLSDGSPWDGRVAPEFIGNTMKHNIAMLEKSGVEVIGIGIQDDSVKRFYKRHMVIDNPTELPKVVTAELRHLLVG